MLYTVVMDYRGGTYVSQVQADNVDAALRAWAAALDVLEVAELGDRRKTELIREVETQLSDGMGPVPLNGLTSAWCTSASVSGGSMLINIIGTVD